MLHVLMTLACSIFLILQHSTAIKEVGTIGVQAPIDGLRYDFDMVYNYTKYLHGLYRFNGFVIFSHYEARRRPKFLNVRTFEQALQEDFKVPLIACGLHGSTKLRKLIGLNNMVFVQFNSMKDAILETVDYNLEGLHFITILFVYKAKNNKPPTSAELREFFAWCWYRNMINVALTFQTFKLPERKHNWTIFEKEQISIESQVYSYTPFPNLTVYNLNAEIAKGQGAFTIDRIKNVNGYVFKTPVYNQVPSVFLTPFDKQCKGLKYCAESLTGITGLIFKEYIRQINGSIEIVIYDNFDAVIYAAARKHAHIVPNSFSDFVLGHFVSEGSYPIFETKVCVTVPVEREMERRYYLPRAFQANIWNYVLLIFLLLFSFEIIFNFKASKGVIQCLGFAMLSAINLLLVQRFITSSTYTERSSRTLFYTFICLMAFVLTSIYAASLLSMLRNPPDGQQIDTLAQFLASDLEIIATNNDRAIFFETHRFPAELIPRLRIVSLNDMNLFRSSLNNSFAFLANTERWKLLNYQQQHLHKPIFHYTGSELCSPNAFLRLPLQYDSPFAISLTFFFMIMQESGHTLKYREMSMNQARRLNFIKFIEAKIERWAPLSMQHFIFVIQFVSLMWLVSITCFCLEYLWFHLYRKYFPRLKRQFLNYQRQLKRLIMQ